jgi:hypothetical protein
MNAKKYELLTRVFFLTAVVSSMLYGKLGSLRWMALGLGIAAAVGAAATYFYNVYSSERPPEEAVSKVSREAQAQTALAHSREVRVALVEGRERRVARMVAGPRSGIQGTLWRESLRRSVVEEGKHGRYYMMVAEYQKHLSEGVIRQERLHIRERQLFLDEVVELVNRLTPTCEVQVSLADRQLTIRPVHNLNAAGEPGGVETPVALNSHPSREVN